MRKSDWLLVTLILLMLASAIGCSATDRLTEDFWLTNLYASQIGSSKTPVTAGYFHNLYIDGTAVTSGTTGGGGGGAETDPVWGASPSFGITAGDIANWNAGGATTFLGLTDTPDSYVGQTDKVLVGNATEDGLVFADPIPKATDWSGNFNWDTSAYTTTEIDISVLFSDNLTGTARRKYSVYLDLTNIEVDANFVSLYLAIKTKVDGTNYRAIDRKTILKADIAANAEPGVAIVMPAVSQDVQITAQMSVALVADATIYYAVVKEHLE